ncbi:hypothetical protein [uncultured Enterovirga sp.]|uniref:hypothetical protein n=1 Tax=uncultured Enterovirga sp. TaxID=2026352 RepID=UPI0035CA74EC
MPTFELTTPDGRVFEVNATDAATAHRALTQTIGSGTSPAPSAPATSSAPAGLGFDEATGARATQERFSGYNGIQTETGPDAALGYGLTRKADEMLVGPDSITNRASATLLNAAEMVGMGLPRNIGAGIATALGNGRTFRQNFDLAGDHLSALGRQSPGARDLGVAAGVVGSLGLPVANVLGGATLAQRAGNTAATVGGYSGIASLAESGLDRVAEPDTIAKAIKHAGFGVIAGGLTHGAIEVAAPRVSRAARDWLAPDAAPASAPAAAVPDVFPKGVSPAVAREAEAGQFGINLTKGQATGDYAQQASENMMARGGGDTPPGQAMRSFFQEQERQVGAAKGDIGRQIAGGADLVERPFDAGARVGEFARNSQRLAETVAGGEEAAAARASQALAPADPINAATDVAAGVRGRAAADRAQFKGSYDEAAREPGAFEPGSFDRIGPSIEARIANSDRPIPIDPALTPAASRAMADLGRAPPAGTSMAEVDQARKRLVALRGSTGQNATDRAAMDQVIRHYDDHVEDALASKLFSGSDRALDLYRTARSQFAGYQRTYRPQGAGDDVGRAMQQIVDRNAQPQEVASLLYGTSLTGNTGRAMRLADRLKEVLPAELWEQTQRGYLGRIVGDGLDHGKISDNIQKALSGEGRGLTYKLLGDAQVAGLRSIQSGLRSAAAAREAVPDWVKTLGKDDFEPKAVIENLFGKSTLTGNTASIQFAKGVRDVVGAESDTWAAVRQAGWQHLVAKPEGATADFGPQAIANRISNFLEKDGRGLATVMFSAEERATMKAFGNTMRTLTPARIAGGSASPNSDTAPMLARSLEALRKHEGKLNMLLSAVGLVSGGPAGAAAAYGVAKGAGAVASRIADRQALARAAEAAAGAPAAAAPVRPRPTPPKLPPIAGPLGPLLGLVGAN